MLKRATNLDITSISLIFYLHCYSTYFYLLFPPPFDFPEGLFAGMVAGLFAGLTLDLFEGKEVLLFFTLLFVPFFLESDIDLSLVFLASFDALVDGRFDASLRLYLPSLLFIYSIGSVPCLTIVVIGIVIIINYYSISSTVTTSVIMIMMMTISTKININ